MVHGWKSKYLSLLWRKDSCRHYYQIRIGLFRVTFDLNGVCVGKKPDLRIDFDWLRW